MKAVGVTLIIQGINFFLAYLILRRFIFNPAAIILEQQEAQKLQLQSAINQAFEQKKETKLLIGQRLDAINSMLQAQVPEPKTYQIDCNKNQDLELCKIESLQTSERTLLAQKVVADLSKVVL